MGMPSLVLLLKLESSPPAPPCDELRVLTYGLVLLYADEGCFPIKRSIIKVSHLLNDKFSN